MAFIEVEFPTSISFKAMGGPSFFTTINEGFSGYEQRNQNWAATRGEWDVSLTTPSESTVDPLTYINQLTSFFLISGGRANGFRLKDHKDYTNGTTAQTLGAGDGTTSLFQLVKAYTAGNLSYVRPIYKPITSAVLSYLGAGLADSVGVKVNGVAQVFNPGYVGGALAQYTLDETTGLVNFGAATQVSISAVSVNGTTATYTYTLVSGPGLYRNQQIVVTGLANSGNNGSFIITSLGTGTFSVTNISAVAHGGDNGTGWVRVSQVAISAAVRSGSNTIYTYTLTSGQPLLQGMRIAITGMADSGNNGVFYISALGAGTFTVINTNGVTRPAQSGAGYTDWVPALSATVAATYQFHFPVRFDTDKLSIQVEDSDIKDGRPVVSWNSITLRELRLVAGQG